MMENQETVMGKSRENIFAKSVGTLKMKIPVRFCAYLGKTRARQDHFVSTGTGLPGSKDKDI